MTRLLLYIILGLLGVIAYFYFENMHLQGKLLTAMDYKSLYESKVKENQIYKDQNNHWRNKAESAVASAKTLKSQADAGNQELISLKSEFKELKNNYKNLESFSNIQTETTSDTKGIVHDTVIIVQGNDTIVQKEETITAQDAWNIYNITLSPDHKTANIHREGKEEFDEVVFWQRLTKNGNKTFWPFGKKVWSSEVVSKNPDTKVIKLSSLIVKKKK